MQNTFNPVVQQSDQSSVTSATSQDVLYGNDIHVSIGEGGTIYRSENGGAWTDVSLSDTTANFRCGLYANESFIALTDDGRMFSSVDGIAWLEGQAIPNTGNPNDVSCIIGANGAFLIGGTGIWVSLNANKWDKIPSDIIGTGPSIITAITDIAYGNTRHIYWLL